jgi:RHS repeat-associated protein
MTRYYYAGATRLAMRVGAGTGTEGVQFLLGDYLGSTSVTTDGSGGSVVRQGYTPWGAVRYQVGGALSTAYRFTGQRESSSTGLQWFRSRWYDPNLSRFLTPDSIVPDPYNPLDYDRYSYVLNNPINMVDPSGHKPCSNGGDSFDTCEGDTFDKYIIFKQHDWEKLSDQRDSNTITGGVNLFYEGIRKYLFFDFGMTYLTKNGKIQDKALIAFILRVEVYDLRTFDPVQYKAALSAMSNQYNSNRYLYPGAGPICGGDCTLSEQTQWLRDFSATWKFTEESNPIELATDGAWQNVYPDVILKPTGSYWAWGNVANLSEADKYKKHTRPTLYGGSYFFVYGFNFGWNTPPLPMQ